MTFLASKTSIRSEDLNEKPRFLAAAMDRAAWAMSLCFVLVVSLLLRAHGNSEGACRLILVRVVIFGSIGVGSCFYFDCFASIDFRVESLQ